jgi:hypothetical protein
MLTKHTNVFNKETYKSWHVQTQLALAKVFRSAEDCLFKIGMLKESQATVSPWLAKQMR